MDGQPFNCEGLRRAFEEHVSVVEVDDEVEGEIEAHEADEWMQKQQDIRKDTVHKASKGVTEGTDKEYERLILLFIKWMEHNGYTRAPHMAFFADPPPEAPDYICMWILEECDDMELNGSAKPPEKRRSSYSHAMKMRASVTYAFGRKHSRGTQSWHLSDQGQWLGNPSISMQVSKYMVSLRKRKIRGGEAAMSSRAITPQILQEMWNYNLKHGKWDIGDYEPKSRPSDPKSPEYLNDWGGGRTRRALWALYTVAFCCLLRFDEALKIQIHDIEVHSPTCLKITLPFRKTDQFGGVKPFYVHLRGREEAHLCPVRAICEWLSVAGIQEGYIFRQILSGDRVSVVNQPMTQQKFLELFRNNLLDIGVDPWPYGTHSFRRGGCQWLSFYLRWHWRRICDWGGWSSDYGSATIVKYLISWNDDPLERREDLLDPNRAPALRCTTCGRSCHCC